MAKKSKKLLRTVMVPGDGDIEERQDDPAEEQHFERVWQRLMKKHSENKK